MKNSTNLHLFAKSILALVCLIAAQTVGAQDSQMNIYATKLVTVEDVTRDGRIATLRFTLNSSANSVTIYVDANDNEKFEAEEIIPTPYTMVGGNYERDKETTIKCTIPESLKGGEHNWAVKVQATAYNTGSTPLLARAANNTDNRYKFHLPKALAISTNYDNPYCGYAFVGEAGGLSGLAPADKTSFRLGSSQGIYVFGPSLGTKFSDNVKTSEAPFGAFKGSNVDWWTADPTAYNYGPSHLATDKDGYVYVCQIHRTNKTNGDNSTEIHNRVWRVHADNLKEGNPTPAFECVLTTDTLSANGVSKRTLAIAVGEGSNGTKILYVISGTLHSTESTLDGSQKLSSWTIKENGDGTCTLEFIKKMDLGTIAYKTKAGATKNQSLISPLCSIAPDKEGGLWIFQKASSNADDEKFAALHLDSQWKADYRIPSYNYNNTSGGGAISAHYAKGNTSEYYLALPTKDKDTDNQVIRVFRIFKSEGYLTRALTYTITNPLNNTDDFGTLNAVAFDAANNLYFTSSYNGTDSNTGRLYVYALPKENEHTTSAPTTEQLDIPYKVTWNRNSITEDYTSATTYNYMYSSDVVPTLGKTGYKFHGWYEDPNFSGAPITCIEKDITLYARWTKLELYEDNATANQTVLEDDVNGYHGSVWVYRKLQGGMFSSLCLPFDVTTDILNKATNSAKTSNPLSGATLWTFSSVSTEGDGTKILHFTPTDTVTANTPFLIEPTDDIAEEIFFHGVTISKPTNYQAAGTVTNDGITFTGIINPVTLAAGSNTFFLVSDNRLAIPAAGGATLGGLRGYFTNPSGARLAIRTQQNTPTLLESVNCNIKNTYKILQDGKIYIIRDGVMYDIKGYRL